MERRTLGNTGIEISTLGFGASSLGAEFRPIQFGEAVDCVRVALDLGMNIIDTSPYYGRGLSETVLGYALQSVPRDSYYICTKLGRYSPTHFDFSAKRVEESAHVSLERMKLDELDILLCHDIEFTDLNQIIDETIPAMQKLKERGLVKWIGVSGYPMKIFREIIQRSEIDVILSYNHYTLQNTMLADEVDFLERHGIGIMNAAPFSARLLTDSKLPEWHRATPEIQKICSEAADHCRQAGSDIAKLALQYSLQHPKMATCFAGSANPERVAQWVTWANELIDQTLLDEVLEILKPIHNWFYIEGRPENNDVPNQVINKNGVAHSSPVSTARSTAGQR